MDSELSRFDFHALRQFTSAVFTHCGLSTTDAAQATDVLLRADLRGVDSHGIARLPVYFSDLINGTTNPTPNLRVVCETPSTATVDGDGGLGLVVGPRANELAMKKALDVGSGWVAVRGSTHYGIAGYYTLQAVEKDLIGWAMTNGTRTQTPLWGADMMLGTNPISVSFPALEQDDIIIDMSTSVVTAGRMDLAMLRNESVPAGWLVEPDGQPTSDPSALLRGGPLLPLGAERAHGGHKGYCLAAMVDIFSGVLSGANWGPFVPSFTVPKNAYTPPVGVGTGHLFGAMRVEAFRPAEEFKKSVDHWIRVMKGTKPSPGATGPLVPGEPEREEEEHRRNKGIPLLTRVVDRLREVSEQSGIPLPAPISEE
jgi:LDH2 family malate/lactate/ureidoglycolate dehydrogenase